MFNPFNSKLTKKFTFKLIISVLICQLAGFLGSLFTNPGTWYAELNKPFFNPPSWVFFPVWTILYLLMGISLALAWQKKIKLTFFWIQLGLNVLWSILFFGMHQIFFSFIEIIILDLFIVLTIISFYKKSKPAASLLLPYLLWVSFAALLNFMFLILN